jgi:hypothetical protein
MLLLGRGGVTRLFRGRAAAEPITNGPDADHR